jgi:hypothetical protein
MNGPGIEHLDSWVYEGPNSPTPPPKHQTLICVIALVRLQS